MQPHDIQWGQLRDSNHEQCGNNSKVFGHIIRNGESRKRTARHQQLLAYLYYFNQLGRVIVKVYHIAGFLCSLRTAIHGNPHICLRQRGGIIGSVSHHGNQFAGLLFFLDILHFILRLCFGNEIIHTGFFGNIFGGQRVVTGHHDRLHPHFTKTFKAFLDARLDNVLQFYDSQYRFIDTHYQRGTAIARNDGNRFFHFFREFIPRAFHNPTNRIERTFADLSTVLQVDTGTFGFGRKLNHVGSRSIEVAHTMSVLTPQLDDGLSFRGFIGKRGQ